MALPDGVTLLLAPNPSPLTLSGTNTYLVRGAQGCLVIDPGPEIESHLVTVADAARAQGGARAILITHGHPDHVAGAARLRELCDAPVIAWSREGVQEADATLEDDARVSLGDRAARALYTPGHRYDHLCFALEENGQDAGVILAGDLVAGAGTVVIAPPEGDLGDYLASLQRVLALGPRLILPGHGPQRNDARALLEGYIAHREERERQLLGALTVQPASVPALVAAIYTDTPAALHPVAAYSLLAGLVKLEREGRVERSPAPDGEKELVALGADSPLALEGVVGRPEGLSAWWRLT
jgi:glyoxylase-like metal-dependent hydrolase (beta-lactamase superfamily II)